MINMEPNENGKIKQILLVVVLCVVIALGGVWAYFEFFTQDDSEVIAESAVTKERSASADDLINIDDFSHPKIEVLREALVRTPEYQVGNTSPFEPYK